MNLETGKLETIEIEGRHDACIAIRMPVSFESATAIVLAVIMLRDRAMAPERGMRV